VTTPALLETGATTVEYRQRLVLALYSCRRRYLGAKQEEPMAQVHSDRQVPLVEYRPKAPTASLQQLRELSGVLPITLPAPVAELLDESEDEASAERGCD
jgi:hypothetical protein